MERAYLIECRILVDDKLKEYTIMPTAYRDEKSVIRTIRSYIYDDKSDGFKVTDDNEPFTLTKNLYDMEIKYIYSYRMVYIYD